ncbi:hypothetical protein, partial [Nonomuraea antimicrobica]|uniref:hypothetical protein n=1 Tax=Nonomuraea antimicrobica TaxID=561173 RepID=UPI0031E8B12D
STPILSDSFQDLYHEVRRNPMPTRWCAVGRVGLAVAPRPFQTGGTVKIGANRYHPAYRRES